MVRGRSASANISTGDLPPSSSDRRLRLPRASAKQLFADLSGAGKGHLVHLRMAGQMLSQRCAGTGKNACHAFGHTGFQQQAAQVERRERREFGGLEQATAACRQRRGQLPGCHHQRAVPGHDLRRHAHRLVADQAVEALARHRWIEGGAGQLGTPAGVVAEGFGGVRHFAVQRGGIELAAVERFEFRQRLRIALDQLRHAQQNALFVRRRLPAPAPVEESGSRRFYCRVRLIGRSGRHAGDFPAVGGVDDGLWFAALSGQPLRRR